MNFNESIFANRPINRPYLVAHRGVAGANIPCNTLAAIELALRKGADVVELDVSKSRDGQFFVFHPGKESVFTECSTSLSELDGSEIAKLKLRNSDGVLTGYNIPTLNEALTLLKDRAYINVDKYWTDVEGITREIRRAGVERQVIVKTPAEDGYLDEVEQFAPDLMFMALDWHKDGVTERLKGRKIRYIGVEALFDRDDDPIISANYIDEMHKKGLLVWVNAIVYDEREVISAFHNDDLAVRGDKYGGWGWLVDRKVDFIQTDWLSDLKEYLIKRNNI